ncbi:MAG: hypothetical protein AAFO75_11315, partial [Pseudomonadota bacterium]
ETTDYTIGDSSLLNADDAAAAASSDAEEEARMFEKLQSMSNPDDAAADAEPVETAEDVFGGQPSADQPDVPSADNSEETEIPGTSEQPDYNTPQSS